MACLVDAAHIFFDDAYVHGRSTSYCSALGSAAISRAAGPASWTLPVLRSAASRSACGTLEDALSCRRLKSTGPSQDLVDHGIPAADAATIHHALIDRSASKEQVRAEIPQHVLSVFTA
jgi:hypothetical protein